MLTSAHDHLRTAIEKIKGIYIVITLITQQL